MPGVKIETLEGNLKDSKGLLEKNRDPGKGRDKKAMKRRSPRHSGIIHSARGACSAAKSRLRKKKPRKGASEAGGEDSNES